MQVFLVILLYLLFLLAIVLSFVRSYRNRKEVANMNKKLLEEKLRELVKKKDGEAFQRFLKLHSVYIATHFGTFQEIMARISQEDVPTENK